MYEKLELQLQKLLLHYIRTGKQIDNKFLDKVVEIAVTNLGLDDYICDIKVENAPFTDEQGNILDKIETADYTYETKRMTINLEGLLALLQADLPYLRFNSRESMFYFYSSVIQTILHEVEHARHIKTIKDGSNSLDAKLFRLCYRPNVLLEDTALQQKVLPRLIKDYSQMGNSINEEYRKLILREYVKRKMELYKEAYKYAPHERLAEHASINTTLGITNQLEKSSLMPMYWMYKLYSNYLRGYPHVPSPTKFYLEKMGYIDSWPEIEQMGKGLSLERRLSLGLRITIDEQCSYLSKTDRIEDMILR